MRRKVERITNLLVETFKKWDSVVAVVRGESSDQDITDPYFALVVDVYYSNRVPDPEERRAAFGDPGAFESAENKKKDRFFLEELPIRIEYKRKERIDEILERKFDLMWVFKGSGTYMFYRMDHGTVLFDKYGWVESVRKQIQEFPDSFWDGLRETFQAKMEHYLSDIGGAALRDDTYFFMISVVGFLRYVSATLFMINHRFEPSHRNIEKQLSELPKVPEGFWGRWENVCRIDGKLSPGTRFQIAQQLALSILAL